MIPTNPCRDCEKRHERCHADCEDYHAWKAEYDQYKANKKAFDEKMKRYFPPHNKK